MPACALRKETARKQIMIVFRVSSTYKEEMSTSAIGLGSISRSAAGLQMQFIRQALLQG